MAGNSAIRRIAVFNLVGSIMAMVKGVLIASMFGTSLSATAYFATTSFIALLARLRQSEQLFEITLPVYQKLKSNSAIDATRYWNFVFTWMCLFSFIVMVACYVAGELFLRARLVGFTDSQLEESLNCLHLGLPVVVMSTVCACLGSLAYAEKMFGLPELCTAIARVVAVGVLLTTYDVFPQYCLMYTTLSATVVNSALLLGAFLAKGFRFRPTFRFPPVEGANPFSSLLRTYPFLASDFVYRFVLDTCLSLLGSGAFTLYKHVETIFQGAERAFLNPISQVFFSQFASMRAFLSQKRAIEVGFNRSIQVTILFIFPIMLFPNEILRLIWGTARFSDQELAIAQLFLVLSFSMFFPIGIEKVARKAVLSFGMVVRQYYFLALVQLASAGMLWLFVLQYELTGFVLGFILANLLIPMVSLTLLRKRRKQYIARVYLNWLADLVLVNASLFMTLQVCVNVLQHYLTLGERVQVFMFLFVAVPVVQVTIIAVSKACGFRLLGQVQDQISNRLWNWTRQSYRFLRS